MTSKTRKVRIQDVAALAGVSMGSASRVLNQAANVTPEVREKVERAVKALGYRPSLLARAMRSRTTLTIGCMLSDIANPLYARTFRAMEDDFREHGYMLLLANGLNDVARELEILDTFQARGMDGVILAPGHEGDARLLERINRLTMPVVLYDREVPGSRADAVLYDHEQAMQMACDRLFQLGHRRIALALWNADSRPVRLRIAGFRQAHQAAGRASPDDLILQQATPTSSVRDDLLQLLRSSSPPTALIAQGSHTLVSALRAIDRHGLRIADDFSVIGIGDSDFAEIHDPPISVLKTDSGRVATQIRRILLERMSGPADTLQPRRQALISYDFVERASVGPCRG